MKNGFIKPKKSLSKKTKERHTRLNPVKFGIAGGIITGAIASLFSLMAIYFPQNYFLIKEIYGDLGYSSTYLGALLGGVYGFIDGFVIFFIFSWLYNKLL
ncbi:MAG: hypothetical protein QXI33_02960 [Candidatus Pacearchaeota archaeon]